LKRLLNEKMKDVLFYSMSCLLETGRHNNNNNNIVIIIIIISSSTNSSSSSSEIEFSSSPYTSRTNQIRINIHKRKNKKKNTVQTIQNTVNTSTHITKTPTHYKTRTYTPTGRMTHFILHFLRLCQKFALFSV